MTRTDIINRLIEVYGYTSYLEIGVYNPSINFDKIKCKKKVGIDPDKNAKATKLMTSDAFFKQNRYRFDIVFIDGLHHAEQVIKDIDNALLCLNDNGTIVVHDCNPTSDAMQRVPRIQGEWTGDVWKAWLHFRANRSDLSMTVLNTDYGVGVIRKGRQRLLPLPDDPAYLTYERFDENREHWLNLVSPELDPVSICIPAFEQYGHGANTLAQLFESMVGMQGNFEVCVSDNSDVTDDGVVDVISKYKDIITVKYKHNPERGISANTNSAVEMASHKLIKVMYQDDLFLSTDAINDIAFALKFDKWVACAGMAITDAGRHYRAAMPLWTNDIVHGHNTLGMPSVTAWRVNGHTFDTKLKTLIDCDYYHSLYEDWGKPGIIRKQLIGSRYWDGSTSRRQGNLTDQEIDYVCAKHGLKRKLTMLDIRRAKGKLH